MKPSYQGRHDTVIVGGGVSGLTCAIELEQRGRSVLVLEASDDVGGRVRTDEVDGFLLDRGFQVLLTAYPECRRLLDYESLDLRPFYPGSIVRSRGRFSRVADPFRRPWDALRSLASPVGSFPDKLRILGLRRRSLQGTLAELFEREETTTLEALRSFGFSESMIERFFRPFLGGVFFDLELETSSRMLEFVFRMFSSGPTALPAGGMGEITRQLRSQVRKGAVRVGTRVRSVAGDGLVLQNGESISARSVVVATNWAAAARLVPGVEAPASRSTVTLYFATRRPPVRQPTLVLDGEGEGPVTTLAVPSLVSSAYAPDGAHLVSANVIGSGQGDGSAEDLEASVRDQMKRWFGDEVRDWRLLRSYRIEHALPSRALDAAELRRANLEDGLFLCGDYCENASINGAMVSGAKAAASVERFLGDGAFFEEGCKASGEDSN